MAGIRCTPQDLWLVSQTLYGECRGEPEEGQVAVAWVIRNRQEWHRRWQGQPLGAIVHARMQFSCWSAGDPNLAALRDVSLDNPVFVDCMQVAVAVLGGLIPSNVGQSTHYYAPAGVTRPPLWVRDKTPYVVIGGHQFYEDIA